MIENDKNQDVAKPLRKTRTLKSLQKHTPTISILLLVALLVALLFYPDSSRGLSMGILIFSIGTAIIFIVHRNWQEHKEDEFSRSAFFRNTALDLVGLALTMGAAIWLGRLAGGYAGMGAGFIGAWSIGRVWGMVRG